MKVIIFALLLTTVRVFAFVSGPGVVGPGENYVSLGLQSERGKVEPNENKSSYQDAEIDVYKVRYVRGTGEIFGLSGSNVYLEYGAFSSAEERVGATLFHEKDDGSYITLGFAADIVQEATKRFGFYLQASPHRSYDEDKFSNPRLDIFALGLTSAYDIAGNFFQRSLIHYGSGDGSDQNSYLAIDTGFGYRIPELFHRQVTLLGSLFLEADMSERHDDAYDAAFSPGGSKDRIRAFKYGTVLGLQTALTEKTNLSINYLQKLGGYDARSTQIYTANIGLEF